MSETGRVGAQGGDIMAHVRSALVNATGKGGIWKQIGQERLGPVVSLVTAITAELDKASRVAEPLFAIVSVRQKSASAVLRRVHDDLWSALGKPATDAALSLLFPGGLAYYADGSADEAPDRMELLAQLLEAGVHPKLPPERAKASAAAVRTHANALRDAINAARIPRARLRLLERAAAVVTQSAEAEVASVRRRLMAEGIDEAEIDSVIPARPPSLAPAEPPPEIPPGGLKLA